MRLASDQAWAVMTIWQEARGEPYEGKIAVGEVIRNRARQRYSSDGSVAGTVLHHLQFSGWNENDPNRIPSAKLDDTDPVVDMCIRAWIESGTGSNFAKGAVLYANLNLVQPTWINRVRWVAHIGQHSFFVPV